MTKNKEWVSLTDKRTGYAPNFVAKRYDDVDLDVKDNEVVATVSTDSIDRAGEIVLPKGMDLNDFRKQPGVYFEHNTDALAIGGAKWIKATDKSIIAKYQLVPSASPDHYAISELVKAGVYRSHSIGFVSTVAAPPSPQELRFHPEWKGANNIHRQGSLLEFSLVGVPCNTDAVAIAVAKGFNQTWLDRLSGKTENTATALAEVVEAVENAPELKKFALTEKELKALLVKRLDTYVVNFDADKVLSEAMRRLSR